MLRFCLLFLMVNINILINESYDVVYRIINQNEKIQYLNCVDLNKILINKTRINLNKIGDDIDYGLRSLQINNKNYNQSIIDIEKILNQIKSKNYLVYRNRICFLFNNSSDFKLTSDPLNKIGMKPITYKFDNETFNIVRYQNHYQITIQHKEYPYSSCSKDYSNFKCLNDKIKQIQRLSKYYYDSSENGSIEINYQINQTIIDNEIKIINQCKQIDCKINLFYFSGKPESIKLESFLFISKLDFYLQLIGLIVLFLNIPIYELTMKIINSICLESVKVKNILIKLKLTIERFKFFKYLKLNYLIVSISIICLLILFSRSIYSFIDERDYPSIKSISVSSIQSELSVAICIQIEMIKENGYNINNRSLLEIENDTNNGLNIVLKDIYLKFLNKKISTKWQLESELILFKFYIQIYFQRCFQLTISLNEPKYLSIFSITKLIIEFKKNKNGVVYILTDNEIFNSNSHYNNPTLNFRKRIIERSKLNKIKKCKDYNLVDDNCISRWDCIDQCTNREIYIQIKNLTKDSLTDLFINKNYFTDKEWANLFIIPNSSGSKIFKKIRKECEDKYSKFDPCIEIKFEHQFLIDSGYDLYNTKIEIDLNYDVIYYKEDEVSIFKLLLDLLNIQGNLFGLNFFTFSFMILTLFKLNLKLIKILKLLIYPICLFGFIYHLWSIYNEIINIKIIFSEHYELINSIQMPVLIFCFDLNQTKLNSNYKLTYDYLDKITSDELIEDKIFSKIEYLNSTNKWIKLDNKTNFQDNNLEIRIFYYLERKCFKIVQTIDYKRNQFEFDEADDDVDADDADADDHGLVLKIFFNRIYLNKEIFYFFTKTKNKFQYSRIQQLNLLDADEFKFYRIKHETIKRDEFELIKNPLSLLSGDQNNLDKFFVELINYFDTKLNMVTFELPFEKTDLNSRKELVDDLFIQLYYQHQKQDQTNHLRPYSINRLKINAKKNQYSKLNLVPDFRFNLLFYKKVIVVSNKISLIKLLINLLNVLSFWFDLGILELDNYLCKIKLLPLHFYKLLFKIKNKLSITF